MSEHPHEAGVGARLPVLVRRRGSAHDEHRGDVEIEDLTEVLTRLSSRTGPNGPQSPVTQYILAQAEQRLAEQLQADVTPDAAGQVPPRILSAVVGHEPFVERALDLSVHQMRRRWPAAGDWYADLVAYLLRPSRHHTNRVDTLERLEGWFTGSAADFVEALVRRQLEVTRAPTGFHLSNALYALWPDYEPVVAAREREAAWMIDQWLPLYEHFVARYGAQVRPGIDLAAAAWAGASLVNAAARGPAGGREDDWCVHASIVLAAGTLQDADGRLLTPERLSVTPALP